MTPPVRWHPDAELILAYVQGLASSVQGASFEAHLLACKDCRSVVRDAVPALRLANVLEAVDNRLDGFQRPWVERWLCRLGVQESDVRVLLAAPSLRFAWWGAVVGAALLALLVAQSQREPQTVFLVLAPLLPALATAAAYAPGLDPARGLVAATPFRMVRLLLIRSLAVGVTAMAGVFAAALALPSRDVTMAAWLLPALALTMIVLALSPWLSTEVATGAVGFLWLGFVVLLHRGGVDLAAAIDGDGQWVSAALTALASAFLITSWRRFDEGGPQ